MVGGRLGWAVSGVIPAGLSVVAGALVATAYAMGLRAWLSER